MPPPPPPPPPPGGLPKGPPGPPPPPAMNNKAPSAPMPNRGNLLNEIHKGTKLKKVQTNDRSAPIIERKTKVDGGSEQTSNSKGNSTFSAPAPPGAGLGGLFAGGIPKLKSRGTASTGKVEPVHSPEVTSSVITNKQSWKNTSPVSPSPVSHIKSNFTPPKPPTMNNGPPAPPSFRPPPAPQRNVVSPSNGLPPRPQMTNLPPPPPRATPPPPPQPSGGMPPPPIPTTQIPRPPPANSFKRAPPPPPPTSASTNSTNKITMEPPKARIPPPPPTIANNSGIGLTSSQSMRQPPRPTTQVNKNFQTLNGVPPKMNGNDHFESHQPALKEGKWTFKPHSMFPTPRPLSDYL